MGIIERHSPDRWRATAKGILAEQAAQGHDSTTVDGPAGDATGGKVGASRGVNANGAPLLGDSRDLFRPKTGDIPAEPGVYKWRDSEGRVIYVGKAKNLRNRLTNYFQPLDQLHPRTQTMVLTARSL